jgi:hypothetical protein
MLKGCGNPGTETENKTINIGKYWHRKLEITGTVRSSENTGTGAEHEGCQAPNTRKYWYRTDIWKLMASRKKKSEIDQCSGSGYAFGSDPDPYVFGPPGSASGSVSHKYGSRSFPFLIKVLSGLK